MTVKELVTKFAGGSHFVISLYDPHKNSHYYFEKTYFTKEDYEAVENSAWNMGNAKNIIPVYGLGGLPVEITKMEVGQFNVYEQSVLLIYIYI